MKINELFTSIQGEGVNCGIQTTFIRAQGCPVGCPWCDSGPNYHPDDAVAHVPSAGNTWGVGGIEMTVLDIIHQIPIRIPMIVLTGGEPALQNWDELMYTWEAIVGHAGTVWAIETSGQYKWLGTHPPTHVTISPKWSHAANKEPWFIEPSWWSFVKELKYVVDDVFTPAVVDQHIREMVKACPWRSVVEIVLMPEGCPPSPESNQRVLKLLEQHRDWRFGPRLQYMIGVK